MKLSKILSHQKFVDAAPCHEMIEKGITLSQEGNGLDALPIPVSTPGFDSAPTLSAGNVITKDPETGVPNMGTYRCALKAPDRLVVRMATRWWSWWLPALSKMSGNGY